MERFETSISPIRVRLDRDLRPVVEELGGIFDGENRITVLPASSQGPLLETARELETEFLSA